MPQFHHNESHKILVMTAVEAEAEAVLRGLGGDGRFEVALAGVGPVQAAISTTKLLAAGSGRYSLVVSAGIAGGYAGRAEIGSLVVSSEIAAADLGAETQEGFSSLDELGFGSAVVPVDRALAERAAGMLAAAGLPVTLGPALTLATVTGSAATASMLAARFPGAASEGMEGFGAAAAAADFGLPALELRAISNAVGPRDKSLWRIGDALKALEAAFAAITQSWRD
ncbi:futalosine hydrolase [Paenibacillus physcomitrellae]|uniref:Futalosine hydrolase n=1 Tax=Paenibacillus physcomitrellae TaxID=1619311 RepID=A0ABQ1FSM0_9BACL|nr:futalosine hydrolase [Paenibacillus physcomitrellae]GGA27118.1 Futalosine hydrolase [Paenibacillus physcomitrellae]